MAMDDREGIQVGQPKPDVYLALLILTGIALLAAVILMWIEYDALIG